VASQERPISVGPAGREQFSSGAAQAHRTASAAWKGKGRAVERVETPDEFGIRPGADGVVINVVDTASIHSSTNHSHEGHEDEEDDEHSPYFAPGTAASVSTSSLHHHMPSHGGASSDEGRGQTLYLPLEEHSVHWAQTIDVVVQMSIARDTNELLPNELKMDVQQVRTLGCFLFT
jgi:hypothetical protein